MEFDLGRMKKLLDAFERSDLEVMELKFGDTEVFISTGEPAPTVTDRDTVPVVTPELGNSTGRPPTEGVSTTANERGPLPAGTPVTSASPGIFWRSPAPGEPPFVEVGQRVDPDSVIGILEVMKLMNPITAGTSGTVAAIVVENSEQVHKGSVLMVITPG